MGATCCWSRGAGARIRRSLALVAAVLAADATAASADAVHLGPAPVGTPWQLHAIDATHANPDGVRLADVDGDGLPDLASGFERGAVTRVLLHPGHAQVRRPWPGVTVGATPEVEDAVFADLDADGRLDVVSSSEDRAPRVAVHWGPPRSRLLEADAWQQDRFPALEGLTEWMAALPFDVDGANGIDLVLGGKSVGAAPPSQIGWLESPLRPRDTSAWRWHPLATDVRWVMSLLGDDVNGDGRQDVVYTEKKGPLAGVHWLEHPGAPGRPWARHSPPIPGVIGASFAASADLDGDGLRDLVLGATLAGADAAAPQRHALVFLRKRDAAGQRWEPHEIAAPARTGTPKGVAVGDVDLDGRLDLVVSCSGADGELVGMYWLSWRRSVFDETWDAHDISGAAGIKYDLVPLADLDGDGDLDALSSEEKEHGEQGLGVVWYENPTRRPAPPGAGTVRPAAAP